MNWNVSWNHPIGMTPSTNNGNESVNALIKREDTLGKSLNLPTFLHTVLRMTRKWSWALNPEKNANIKIFHQFHPANHHGDPKSYLDLWAKAYQLLKTATIISDDDNEMVFYVKSSESKSNFSENAAKQYKELYNDQNFSCIDKFEFNSFVRKLFSIWRIEITDEICYCSCPKFLKEYICHHVIGILIRLGFKCPPEAKGDNLSQKRFILVFCLGEAPKAVPRGRGRPRGSKNKPKSSLL